MTDLRFEGVTFVMFGKGSMREFVEVLEIHFRSVTLKAISRE